MRQQVCKHPVAVCGGDHRLEGDGHLCLPHQVQQGVHVLIAEVCQHQRWGIGTGLQHQRSGGFYLHLAQQLGDGLAGIGGGMAVAAGAPAAIAAASEDPKSFGKSLIFVALGESIALYGVVISILILNKLV